MGVEFSPRSAIQLCEIEMSCAVWDAFKSGDVWDAVKNCENVNFHECEEASAFGNCHTAIYEGMRKNLG